MNASQQKQVIAVAKKALALLSPEWSVSQSLREQLELAMVETLKPVAKAKASGKCTLCNAAFNAEDVPVDGFLHKKLKEGQAHFRCADMYRRNAAEFSAWCVEQNNRVIQAFDAEAMSHCACGGTADDHAKDELENLLKCSHCDDCEAFHYETADDQQQEAA